MSSHKGPDASHLRLGDRLQIGGQLVPEVGQLGKPPDIAHTYSFRGHSLLTTEEVFCIAVVGGSVTAGDQIFVVTQQ